jgi:hypothetical protein
MSDKAIEPYAGGFIVADYSGKRGRFGAAYAGTDGLWRDQPLAIPPFATKEAAEEWVMSIDTPGASKS